MIELTPLLSWIKASILGIVSVESRQVTIAVQEYLDDAKQRYNDLVAGILKKELTYDFVIRKIYVEEPQNLKAFILSLVQVEEKKLENIINDAVELLNSFVKSKTLQP